MKSLQPRTLRVYPRANGSGSTMPVSESALAGVGSRVWSRSAGGVLVAEQGGGGGNEFAHGDLVTITGSGFGSHDLNGDFLGYHIEATPVGSQPSSRSGWNFTPTGERAPKLGYDDAARGRVFRSVYGTGGAPNMPVSRSLGGNVPLGGRVYVSGWLYGAPTGGSGNRQWKGIRVRNGDDVSDGSTDLLISSWSEAGGVLTPNPSIGGQALSGPGVTTNAWRRVEMEVTYPATQGGNGRVDIRIHNGSSVPTNGNYTFSSGASNSAMNLYPGSGRANFVVFQNYFGNNYNAGSVLQDDHYAQTGTFKRVELCNHATYSSSTRREIQPLEPDGWSGSEVAARINRGAFADGTYHLHVVGENNASLGSREIVLTS